MPPVRVRDWQSGDGAGLRAAGTACGRRRSVLPTRRRRGLAAPRVTACKRYQQSDTPGGGLGREPGRRLKAAGLRPGSDPVWKITPRRPAHSGHGAPARANATIIPDSANAAYRTAKDDRCQKTADSARLFGSFRVASRCRRGSGGVSARLCALLAGHEQHALARDGRLFGAQSRVKPAPRLGTARVPACRRGGMTGGRVGQPGRCRAPLKVWASGARRAKLCWPEAAASELRCEPSSAPATPELGAALFVCNGERRGAFGSAPPPALRTVPCPPPASLRRHVCSPALLPNRRAVGPWYQAP